MIILTIIGVFVSSLLTVALWSTIHGADRIRRRRWHAAKGEF